MANEGMHLSAKGHTQLAHSEAVRSAYYDDEGHNCTFGQGQLAHYGPCSLHELNSTVTASMIDAARDNSIATAEQIVRTAVRRHPLTQEQFDAAVSFVFNVGSRGRRVLAPANEGNMNEVARRMGEYIHVCRHDPKTGSVIAGSCHISQGLISRRLREAAPFRNSP